jgi:8-oxo-dGTP diphosphatase
MPTGLHRALLRLFRLLPPRARRAAVSAFAPSFTVGAICLIERADGRVLLVRQVYRERWGIPGGLLDRGEDPAQAAHREIREEVGLAIDLVGEPASVVDARVRRVDMVFRARPVDDRDADGVHPTSPEISRVAWFRPDELPELQDETTQALAALARAATQLPPAR